MNPISPPLRVAIPMPPCSQIIVLVFLMIAPRVFANEDPHQPEAHGEAPKDGHGKKAEDAPPPKAIEGPDAQNALATSRSDRYVHRWIPIPAFSAININDRSDRTITAQSGRVLVIFFLASWCEPCQQITPQFMTLQQKLSKLPIDFVYVFAHDTLDDAREFATEYKLDRQSDNVLLAEFDVLKKYNNPDLPTIYVGDRRGWILTRFIKPDAKRMAEFKELVELLTAF